MQNQYGYAIRLEQASVDKLNEAVASSVAFFFLKKHGMLNLKAINEQASYKE